jgi:hypothetical protein
VPMVPNGRKPVPFSELYLLEPNDEVVFMFETTLEMIGKGYPHHIEFPAVMERAFSLHKLKHVEGKHPGSQEIMTPIRVCRLGNVPDPIDDQYCECYAEAWWEMIGLPLEAVKYDPNDSLFEKRL